MNIEAIDFLNRLNESGRIDYNHYSYLHDLLTSEEPEWEYGLRLHPDIEYKPNENRATYTPPTTPHPSLERAQEMAKLNPRYRATYHRRRKAGPWEPVKN